MCAPLLNSGFKFKNYFAKHKLLLKLLGVSLWDNESLLYKFYSFSIIFLLDFMYISLDIAELFKQDISVIGDYLIYQLAIILAIAKMTFLLRNRTKVLHMLDRLEQVPFRPNLERGGNVEVKLLEECLWVTNAQAMVYWIFCNLTIVCSVAYTIARRLRDSNYQDLTYGPITVLNITHSPNFEITCLYQTVSVFHLGIMFCTTDLLLAGILAHISYQFKILQNNLQQLVKISYNKMLKDTNNRFLNPVDVEISTDCSQTIDPSNIPWKYLKESLSEAIDYRAAITDLAKDLEETASSLFLFVFLVTLMVAGFLILRSSQVPLDDPRLLSNVGEVVTTCIQVLTVCYWGEEIVLQSQQVGMAAYESDFVGTDIRFQKSLVLIMRQSLNPTTVTTGKFAPIRLTTFVWIMRSGYSAFMMLRNSKM